MVATPLGHLQDINLRALDVLKHADWIACEDTRVTSKLLAHYGISKRMVAAHEHNEHHAAERIVAALNNGERVALVTDAGTPAISDPGGIIVRAVLDAGLKVIPIPGPSAIVTALSAAGCEGTAFAFIGFLPSKANERKAVLERYRELHIPIVLYEAPHRVDECLLAISEVFGAEHNIVMARELTKMFETIRRTTPRALQAALAAEPVTGKGEWVIIIDPANVEATSVNDQALERTLRALLAELPPARAARVAAELTGVKREAAYAMAMRIKESDAS